MAAAGARTRGGARGKSSGLLPPLLGGGGICRRRRRRRRCSRRGGTAAAGAGAEAAAASFFASAAVLAAASATAAASLASALALMKEMRPCSSAICWSATSWLAFDWICRESRSPLGDAGRGREDVREVQGGGGHLLVGWHSTGSAGNPVRSPLAGGKGRGIRREGGEGRAGGGHLVAGLRQKLQGLQLAHREEERGEGSPGRGSSAGRLTCN